MSDSFLGEIRLFSYANGKVPSGWVLCDGALLQVHQNTALFSLIGAHFGGNGTTTFAVPDLRGRVPVGIKTSSLTQLPNTTPYVIGNSGGVESVVLTPANVPAHNHTFMATKNAGDDTGIAGEITAAVAPAAAGTAALNLYARASGTLVALHSGSISPFVGSQSHQNMQPFLAATYGICVIGFYPNRD